MRRVSGGSVTQHARAPTTMPAIATWRASDDAELFQPCGARSHVASDRTRFVRSFRRNFQA